ncbi:MAG TPA: response regulator transcription factor [Desulfocapsa sulfexigens]|nr:response regulator transcription factor [Desulfocapsa sulfexigens]
MITTFLADDHQMFRQGLRTLLEAADGIEVVGEASDGQESLKEIGRLQPNVAVLDVAMPGLSGIEVTKRLAKLAPRTKILILTMHSDTFFAVEALRAKALGFMLKEESITHLVDAIHKVAQGETVVSPHLEKTVFRELNSSPSRKSADSPVNILTARETEILQLVAEGLTNQEIAVMLFISPSTVDTHRKNIMAKLDIHSVAGLVKYAIRHKIVTL